MSYAAAAADDVKTTEEDGVLFVTLNRPQARNALSLGVLAALRGLFAAAAERDDLRLAVLTGAGDKAFASGGDLNELSTFRSTDDARTLSMHGKAALNAIRDCPFPVVAALNGVALGGGAELALACDFRIAASTSSIGFIHNRLAITPSWGGGVDLMRLLGYQRGLKLLLTGEIIAAAEAVELGLVDHVATPERMFSEEVDAFIEPLRRQLPHVARAAKSISRAERSHGRDALQQTETDQFVRVWTDDAHWAAAELVTKRVVRNGS